MILAIFNLLQMAHSYDSVLLFNNDSLINTIHRKHVSINFLMNASEILKNIEDMSLHCYIYSVVNSTFKSSTKPQYHVTIFLPYQ